MRVEPDEDEVAISNFRSSASWKTVRLGDVAKTSSGGTPKRGVSAYYGGEIPWVKSGELGDSTVYKTSESITEAGLKGSSAKLFPKGTCTVEKLGSRRSPLTIEGVGQHLEGGFLEEVGGLAGQQG
jgi:restriction endonuclease S subunit